MNAIIGHQFCTAYELKEYEKREGERMTDEKPESKYEKKWSKAESIDFGNGLVALVSKTVSVRKADKKEFPNIKVSMGYQGDHGRFSPNKFNAFIDFPVMTPEQIDKLAAALKSVVLKQV